MDDKLNIQDLTDGLAENHGMSRRNAESFVKDFFVLIADALERDKYVKVKGLGTFKLIEVDTRESVDVNTGDRIEIQGHNRISFTPDPTLKEAVNKPFSIFETVHLEDGTTFGDTPADTDTPEDNDVAEDMPAADETADDNATMPGDDTAMTPDTDDTAAVADDSTREETSDDAQSEEPAVTTLDEPEAEAPDSDRQPGKDPSEPQPEPTPVATAMKAAPANNGRTPVSNVAQLRLSDDKKKEIARRADGSSMPYLMIFMIIAVLACVGFVGYLYYPDFVGTDYTPSATPTETVQPQDSIEQDTTNQAPAEESSAQQPAETVQKLTTGVRYTADGTLATHTIQKGESLSDIALHYYGVRTFYTYIVSFNNIKNPDTVPFGTTLQIPRLIVRQ